MLIQSGLLEQLLLLFPTLSLSLCLPGEPRRDTPTAFLIGRLSLHACLIIAKRMLHFLSHKHEDAGDRRALCVNFA